LTAREALVKLGSLTRERFWLRSVVMVLSFLGVAQAKAAQARFDVDFTTSFQRTNGWVAGDGAISVPLSDGRVLWLFGDSHLDDLDSKTGTMPCLFQMRNAGLVMGRASDPSNAVTLAGKGPGFRSWFEPSTNIDEWVWPGCGFQSKSFVYVYLFALRKTAAGGMWGFESTGQDLWAKVHFPELKEISYLALPPFNGIAFGNGFVEEGKYVYAFGGKQKGIASDLFVGRFASEKPESKWEFWDGKRWSENVTNAAPVGRGASTSLHVCKLRNKYLLTTSAFSVAADQGKDIFVSTSAGPTGPFSPLKSIYTIDDRYEGHLPFFYFPVSHPELINEKHELLVTYSINGYEPAIKACVDGRAIPDHYRPKAIRVPLEVVDSSFGQSK
jgi:hypothetical protein